MRLPPLRHMILALLAGLLLSGSDGRSDPPAPRATWTFGVGLMTGPSSQPFSLFLVQELDQRIVHAEPISRGAFVAQVQGAIASKANPNAENLFRKYDVSACVHPYDSTFIVPDCSPFDQLWKLRFWEYPYKVRDGSHAQKGWAEKPMMPSERQMAILGSYGILNYSVDLARGPDAFRLLHDVTDTLWVDRYRK